MQSMDMGSVETTTLTQIPSIAPPPESSSYYLQLDPSGHVDILESSLVLSKPDMAGEMVYEIQMDNFVMDERNVEIINMPNFQGNIQNFQGTLPNFQGNIQSFQPGNINIQSFQQGSMNIQNFQGNLQNLQNFQGSFTFQPEYVQTLPAQPQQQQYITTTLPHQPQQQQQYTTTVTYEPHQLQFHIDDASLSQMLLGNNVTLMPPPPPPPPIIAPPPPIEITEQPLVPVVDIKPEVVEDDGFVPDFMVEAEIPADSSNEEAQTSSPESTKEVSADEETSEESESESEGETTSQESLMEALMKERRPKREFKRVKRVLPDNIMEFTEEAVIPPLKEIYPRGPEDKDKIPLSPPPSPSPPPVVNLSDEEVDDGDDDEHEIEWGSSSSNSEEKPEVPSFLHESTDPDDELYISFYSRPDSSKTELCVLCYEWFETPVDLEWHLKSIHQDNMTLYGCKRCGEKFWSRFLRQRHEKTHRYDLNGQAQRSSSKKRGIPRFDAKHYINRLRKAPINPEYRDHIRLLHSQIKSMEFECFVCDKDFQTEEEFREHNEEEHEVQTCIHCRKTFENARDMRKHEHEVHGKITFDKNYPGGAWKLWETSFEDCEQIKEKNDRLLNLYLYHNYSKRMKNEVQSADCDNFGDMGCEEINLSSREATKFMERRKNPDKGKKSKKSGGSGSSKGRKSGGKSKSKIKVKVEHLGEHENEPDPNLPFKCHQCKTSYKAEVDLQRHLKTHTIRSMAYMCQYCGRGFATHSNRKEHERIHTGDKPYVCPICSRAFVQISNLKKHIQTHKDKNNLQCSTCQKQFVKESSLILHQRAHSQDRKFRCHVCDRAYNYASLLKRHMRIHTGENPYSCEDCGQMFHELVSLHYHRKKVHTGERPHRCMECGRAFILSSDLKKHLKIHERDGSCIKANATKTYSRKGRVPIPPSTVERIIAGCFDMSSSSSSPSNYENGSATELSEAAEEEMKMLMKMEMEMDEEDEEGLETKPTESDLEDEDIDEEDRGLVINEAETDLLNLPEKEEVKAEEPAAPAAIVTPTTTTAVTNHETNEEVNPDLNNQDKLSTEEASVDSAVAVEPSSS